MMLVVEGFSLYVRGGEENRSLNRLQEHNRRHIERKHRSWYTDAVD